MTLQSEANYAGFYINLDRSLERRQAFEKQLADLHLQSRYSRFPAIDGAAVSIPNSRLNPGETGIFLSHCRVLENARALQKCVHVLEDDALLSRHTAPVVEEAIAAGMLQSYDLLFTDMTLHCNVRFLRTLKNQFDAIEIPVSAPLRLKQFRVIDLAKVFHAAFNSYVVGPKGLDRLVGLYSQEIEKGLAVPVDIFVQQQVLSGALTAANLFPFVTSIRLEDLLNSTIGHGGEKSSPPSAMVMAVFQYLFFVDCDFGYAKSFLDAPTQNNRQPTDMRHQLMMQAMEFVMSNDFGAT
jgi:GR25 family glycosyltransferase involved in LPS biosynthesis